MTGAVVVMVVLVVGGIGWVCWNDVRRSRRWNGLRERVVRAEAQVEDLRRENRELRAALAMAPAWRDRAEPTDPATRSVPLTGKSRVR